jgi:hypothetical protein
MKGNRESRNLSIVQILSGILVGISMGPVLMVIMWGAVDMGIPSLNDVLIVSFIGIIIGVSSFLFETWILRGRESSN